MPDDAAALTFAHLQRELPRRSTRAWRFAALAALSRGEAALSEGLRVGYRHGFDSGPFMAHVYADHAEGRTPLGHWLDRRLLDRRTCRAFREIRALAESAVLQAIDAHAATDPLVADLAAGPSPYLLEALRRRPDARALLCDLDPDALSQVASVARGLGLGQRVATRRLDAFDAMALAALDPRPDIVLELGLYGIYHDDRLIERHYQDLARTMAPREIVFNVQVDNPEIEYIARVWRNHQGERCVWRLRPLEQILDYARAAGFEPVDVKSDSQGIYRVARLQRRGPGPR